MCFENKLFVTVLSVRGVIFFVICVLSGMFLKDMSKGSSLSKDEHLTPNITKVIVTNATHNYFPNFLFKSIFCKKQPAALD